MIEDSAKKQIKEQETKKQAAQLMNYLLFQDIDDLTDDQQTKNFIVVNYDSDEDSLDFPQKLTELNELSCDEPIQTPVGDSLEDHYSS